MCGADLGTTVENVKQWGSPPRVRSRHHQAQDAVRRSGIISACAEQTPVKLPEALRPADHLRVCGADALTHGDENAVEGSPPRVRSRHGVGDVRPGLRGITSACAEQTVVFYCVLSQLNGVEYLIYALRRVS